MAARLAWPIDHERCHQVANGWAKAVRVWCTGKSITNRVALIDLRCCSWWCHVAVK